MQENKQLFSPIKARILQFIDYRGISKYKFYKETGITRGVLDKKNGICEDNIAKFIACYAKVSAEWLLRGSGGMLKEENEKPYSEENIESPTAPLLETVRYLTRRVQALEQEVEQYRHYMAKMAKDGLEEED